VGVAEISENRRTLAGSARGKKSMGAGSGINVPALVAILLRGKVGQGGRDEVTALLTASWRKEGGGANSDF